MEFTEPVMRPPQEARSLILQATQGCTYNKCNFCYVCRGYPFRIKDAKRLKAEAGAYKAFFPAGCNIYLAGANPFAAPVGVLKGWIGALREVFPDFGRVSMQTRVDDISRKSDSELRDLRGLGLEHLYCGVENGNERVLALMNKGHTARDTVEQLRRLDKAGISYTCFYVLGLGGKGAGQESALATARMFNEVNPARITTTGMTLFETSPIAAIAAAGGFEEASEREKIEELRAFLAALNIDVFYDGVHYLNPVNYRFRTGDKSSREEVLKDIDEILATMNDDELELMVDRKSKISL